jgi:hypothetical protein
MTPYYMKAQRNPNAACPSPARFAVLPDGLAHRGLRGAPLAVALLLMASTVASARTETLRWTHNNPSNVAGFVIHYGLSSGNYTTVIDAPSLQSDAQGIFTFDIDAPDDATIYVAVTAYDDVGQVSAYPNEGTKIPDFSEQDPAIGKPGRPYVVPGP